MTQHRDASNEDVVAQYQSLMKIGQSSQLSDSGGTAATTGYQTDTTAPSRRGAPAFGTYSRR